MDFRNPVDAEAIKDATYIRSRQKGLRLAPGMRAATRPDAHRSSREWTHQPVAIGGVAPARLKARSPRRIPGVGGIRVVDGPTRVLVAPTAVKCSATALAGQVAAGGHRRHDWRMGTC